MKYQYHIGNLDKNTLLSKAINEMNNNPELDCWVSRVNKIKTLLKIPKLYGKPDKVGFVIDKIIKGKFDRYFLDEINEIRIGFDGQDHNKLKLYNTFKGSLRQEPYVKNILDINQRSWLSRHYGILTNIRKEIDCGLEPQTLKLYV